jgi:hypothetical protein
MKETELVESEAAAHMAAERLDLANAALSTATASVASVAAAKAAAADAHQARADLIARLTTPPLDTIEADAAAALGNPPWTDAKTRIEADLPAALRECAAESAGVVFGRLDNDRTRVAQIGAAAGGLLVASDARRIAFEQADARFRAHVVNAKARLDQALTLATRVADPQQSPLTEPERRSVFSKKEDGSVDTALRDSRVEAAGKRKALATAQISLDDATTALEIARAKARAADIDADPELDAAVIAARGAVTAATTARNTARGDLTAAMSATLAEWQLAVPDATWRQLADFDAATRLLDELKADHSALKTGLATAESDYTAALIAARTAAAIDGELGAAESQQQFDAAAASRRIIGALRGDS